ncbi:ubiquitin conjugating enzyme [Paecilomyces variotii No. 5]|uniref:Ubiquitin conjugating enzyme n=1 Tax=Byssochlamys spectabilis (strain No. 5 / NBRC 109023) TaxID=1356009 RepID=V5FY40_BYSSN|nr:ubiquitin conjugating enzyme [Paecilomyces variotii No. 5]
MPRRDFIRDFTDISRPGEYVYLTNIRAGADDGVFCFTYLKDDISIELEAFVTDISSYPQEHSYFVYTTSENVPQAVTEALQKIQAGAQGQSLSNFLNHLSSSLIDSLNPDNCISTQASGHDSDVDIVDDDGEYDDEDWDEPLYIEDPFSDPEPVRSSTQGALKSEIRADLRPVKSAGFKIGILGDFDGPVIITISCRIAKLGISDEAMQAWRVNPQQYLVLLIRYSSGYQDLQKIFDVDNVTGKSSVEMHVALCDSYKPTFASAEQVFFRGLKKTDSDEKNGGTSGGHGLEPSFISRPLNTLLNERLVKILKYRYKFAFDWSGAELFFNDVQGKSLQAIDPSDPKYLEKEKPGLFTSSLLAGDHLLESSHGLSFPLLAMQFTLRHFVRCTEFCLVCHCKIDADFEALKPYVCSNDLCLFQYLSLGFGPSLEFEIISQPNVVDLLVSFTYTSSSGGRLRDFPTGLGIMVPAGTEVLRDCVAGTLTSGNLSNDLKPGSKQAPRSITAILDPCKMELLFPDRKECPPVRVGDWIAIISHSASEGNHLHCRVMEVGMWPVVKLSEPIVRGAPIDDIVANPRMRKPSPVVFVVYDTLFDDLSVDEKRQVIPLLLDTLPSVTEMRSYLMQSKHDSGLVLASWKNRVSKSSLDLLRWIVASNRSCILEDGRSADDLTAATNGQNLVSDMEGYMQFRFAQGAPDKEQRFVQAVDSATSTTKAKYPTIFAWHGSPLTNWHGILREGLHFKESLHGRAFGDGVYLSPDFHTSYSFVGGYGYGGRSWPKSILRITGAISLNEVVNCPSQFVSKSPHLVVKQLDWIQSHYLFVKCEALTSKGNLPGSKITPSEEFYRQDPAYTARGPHSRAVVIPLTAISSKRRGALINDEPDSSAGTKKLSRKGSAAKSRKGKVKSAIESVSTKRKKMILLDEPENENNGDQNNGDQNNGDTLSVGTDDEDRAFLLSDTEPEKDHKIAKLEHGSLLSKENGSGKSGNQSDRQTDFNPGTLVATSLPLLAPPTYATTMATNALQRDLQATLKVQQKTPPHELGWYIDADLIATVYQWIVELHSFDPSLPLAKDLKAAGLQSVVLELRFGKNYPISPPFVRVIRPRFLGFQQGGGGHVTAGGALCMELLTNSGWSAASSIESVLLQVRLALSSTDPKPARLEPGQINRKGGVLDYGVGEAVEAFKRACLTHGWEVPKDFEESSRLVSQSLKEMEL